MKKKLPRDFDAKVYLELHRDVRAAGVDAARHYLEHGIEEGRKYKPSEGLPRPRGLPPLSDISQLGNDGIVILGDNDSPHFRTIIIVGLPRSGTSMPAKALHDLGVWMGDGIDQAVFEDVRLADALERRVEDLSGVIQDYNSRYDIWGFKRPMAFKLLKKHIKRFRNPRIVVMFRDPLAISKRNAISVDVSIEMALRNAAREISDLIDFALSIDVPKMLVSYEKVMSIPEEFVETLVQFVGCNPTPDEFKEAVSNIQNSPELYLISSQTKYSVESQKVEGANSRTAVEI
ncbi:hypothetical protein [Marivivens marinus]|uniref:hypothetical protein n=1 Tax=Marivivens marinus TaxID=3110173 RepID=UPI003B8492A8